MADLTGRPAPLGISADLWDVLACPADHGALSADVPAAEIVCTMCGLRFPVRDGIPVMLIDEATAPGAGA